MKFLTPIICAAFVFCHLSCGKKSDSISGSEGDGKTPAAFRVAVIPKGTTHEFWKAIHAGAEKAKLELSEKGVEVDVIWQGPLREDDRDQQIQVVETFISRQVDGIVLAPLDKQALIRPVETAVKAEIPVVVIDSGLNTEAYASFVATDNELGGFLAAEYMGELLGGKGNVILLRYAVGSASTEARENGFLRGLKEKFPEIKLISDDQYAGATRETAYSASTALLNRFGDQANGVFCVNESSTFGMAKALRDIGKGNGGVKLIGFDTGSQSVIDLANNDLQGLVVQDPVKMGYLGVLRIIDQIQGKTIEKRIDTGVTMVTPENVNDEEVQRLLNPPIEKYLGE